MSTVNVYSPDYDNEGNPKPSIPELKDAIENARIDAENLAHQSSGDVVLQDGTDTGLPSAKVLRDQARDARDVAQTARDGAQAARDDAEDTASNLGALGGIDGTVQTTSDLPSSSGSGDYYFVVDAAAYYQDTGTGSVQGGWEKTGPDLVTPPDLAYDHIVRTASDAQAVFGGGELSAGDAVIVTASSPIVISDWLDIDVSGVTVVGRGPEATFKVADGANVGGFRVGTNAAISDITFIGVGVDCNGRNQTGGGRKDGFLFAQTDGIRMNGCYAANTHPNKSEGGSTSNDSNCLDIEASCSDALIHNCRFINAGFDSVHILADETIISGCVCTGSDNRGISLSDDATSTSPDDVIVVGNIVEAGPWTASGIGSSFPARGHTIVNNYVFASNAGRRAIMLEQHSEGLIANNNIDGQNIESGVIRVDDCQNVNVKGNVLKNCDSNGVLITGPTGNSVFEGNVIDGAVGVGIHVEASSGAKRNKILNNKIRNVEQNASSVSYGILVRNVASRQKIVGNEVYGGDGAGTIVTVTAGIKVDGQEKTDVFDNEVSTVKGRGIWVVGDWNHIRGNRVVGVEPDSNSVAISYEIEGGTKGDVKVENNMGFPRDESRSSVVTNTVYKLRNGTIMFQDNFSNTSAATDYDFDPGIATSEGNHPIVAYDLSQYSSTATETYQVETNDGTVGEPGPATKQNNWVSLVDGTEIT